MKIKNIINKFKCKNAIKKANKLMGKNGRLLVRKSGTEKLIRVMVEAEDISILDATMASITSTIKGL